LGADSMDPSALDKQNGFEPDAEEVYYHLLLVPCSVLDRTIECHLSLSFMEVATKRLTELTPEMDCDQTAMGLPPVTSTVSFIAK
jgi:hypothetical protein